MKIIELSKIAEETDVPTNDDIHIILQFFVHRHAKRRIEIQKCLEINVKNPCINTIHLLNEHIYPENELGISSPKIHQTNIQKRLTFSAAIRYAREKKLQGYIVFVNADIFFDDSLANLRRSTLHEYCENDNSVSPDRKKAFALLRYEYNGISKDTSPLFGPRFDSQDTWIFHSNAFISEKQERAFNIEFGRPGCDNKVAYILKIVGFDIINDPRFIHTFHFHISETRDYTVKDIIPPPWCAVVPARINASTIRPSIGIDLCAALDATCMLSHTSFEDNTFIYDYILNKLSSGNNFILPRVSGIENNIAVFARLSREKGELSPDLIQYFHAVIPAMKNNAGIKISSMNSAIKYSDAYLKAFDNCDVFGGWEPWGNYMGHIRQSYDFMLQYYSKQRIVWAYSLDIFNYIYSQPWTLALRNKRVLIISGFDASIREKIPVREKIYGIDLFPGCDITTIRPPQTHADNPSREFDIELEEFYIRLDAIHDTYDVALVSCGGYCNLVCNHIFESGKSAIYVGGTLQMMFGILGSRWLRETPDIVRLFINEYWSRPKESERPLGFEKIEGACYF